MRIPRNYMNSKYNLSIHLISKYFYRETADSEPDSEPNNEPNNEQNNEQNSERNNERNNEQNSEQNTEPNSEMRARRDGESEPKDGRFERKKACQIGRLFRFFHLSSEYHNGGITTPKKTAQFLQLTLQLQGLQAKLRW